MMGASVMVPGDTAIANTEDRVFRNVIDLRITPVDCIPLRFALDHDTEQIHGVLEGSLLETNRARRLKILAQHVSSESHRSAGVFFLAQAVQVGCVANLGL